MSTRIAALMLAVCGTACAGAVARVDSPAFQSRIEEYMNVRRAAAAEVGPVHAADSAGHINADAEELARAIRERRPNAAEGSIFTPDVADQFRDVLSQVVASEDGPEILDTIAHPNPGELDLHVNDNYPSTAPRTSMPHAVLRVLPELPKELKYRFAGRDLLLLDMNTERVVGILRAALPELPQPTTR